MLPEAKTAVAATLSSVAPFSFSPPPDSTLAGESGVGEGKHVKGVHRIAWINLAID